MIDWPDFFPLPSVAYSADVAANTVRTQMESGRIRSRLRSSVQQDTVDISWEMEDAEFTVFVSFLNHYLNNGSDWFMIDLALGDELQKHQARFIGGKYNHAYVPVGYWNVTAQLEIYQRKIMDKDIMDVYLIYGPTDADLQNFLDSVEYARIFTNITWPSIIN